MLFKDLKEIILEADEEEPTSEETKDGETAEKAEIKEKPRKPQRSIQAVKDASDGIGNESYTISNEIAKTLETDLSEYYNIYKVGASNNKVTITADVKKMKNGLLTSRRTGDAIESETLLNTIQQIITADLGDDIDKFDLNGPVIVAPGVLIITLIPVKKA